MRSDLSLPTSESVRERERERGSLDEEGNWPALDLMHLHAASTWCGICDGLFGMQIASLVSAMKMLEESKRVSERREGKRKKLFLSHILPDFAFYACLLM